ncbi:hypothetical protein ACFP1Z_28500 [Streptomyces gamaensis]|uniref:Antitoxin MazE7 n=1 Tax=Streptomyces gamaensis TaxID=1763542 RepID=A0ABW0Z5L6_9ACTN
MRKIEVHLSDEAYADLQRAAADKHIDPEAYAGTVLEDNLTRARFLEGAQDCIDQHADEFAARFGPAAAADRAA